jgi:hypothetical protein
MRRTLRTMLAAAAVTAAALTTSVALPATAGAAADGAAKPPSTDTLSTKTYSDAELRALPICTDWSRFTWESGPYRVLVPSVGNQTYQTDCRLLAGVYDNTAVWVLQWALNQCYGQNLTHDGDYGNATGNAVKNVQRFHRFPAADIDGVYGPQTRNAMAFPKINDAGAYVGCWI